MRSIPAILLGKQVPLSGGMQAQALHDVAAPAAASTSSSPTLPAQG